MLNLCSPERTVRRNLHLALVFNWGRVRGLRSRYANILLLEGMGMLLFGLLAERLQDAHRSVVVVGVLCFTMGLQNALITRIGEWPVRTTHITGMVTDIGVEIGKALYRSPADAADPVVGEPRRIAALAGLVALFFLGGMAGALGYLWLGFEVVVPVAAVLLLIAHRPLVQDLREAWLRRRPRRPSGRGPRSAR